MKEKNIFLMGLGTGIVITSIISLFSYNILKLNNNSNDMITTTTESQLFKENSTIENQTTTDIVTETTTIGELKLSDTPNFEITTKSFELTTN